MAYKFSVASRVVVFNTCGSYGSGPRKNPLRNFVYAYSVAGLVAILRAAGSGPVRVCFTPVGDDIDMTEVFHDVCRLVMAFGDVVFAIDEIWNFHGPSFLPPVQKKMFLQWRHYGLTVMWAAQQPQLVSSTVRSVSMETYVGKFTDRLDVDAVARCKVKDSAAISAMENLPPYRFIHQFESGEWRIEQAPAK